MQNEFLDRPDREHPGSQPSSAQPGSSSDAQVTFSELKEKVTEDFSSVSDAVKTGVETATGKVKEAASDKAAYFAKQVESVAAALQKVGSELEASEEASIGRYATQIGQSVQTFANRIEGKDISEIASMAEEFGRKQPLAFLGIAALAGLTASRFLTASAKRANTSSTRSAPTSYKSSMTEGRSRG
ncbi:nutrient deprivation-induced protein [Pararhizobium arenae]|uniref:nutrient deprivation-induced protein n=1 Tax=Pararhizobium arenae TaxID=1856850 RepID=UPI00094AFA08|nr:nutrient deprivation-induced protein [Pararhizobium arenae]